MFQGKYSKNLKGEDPKPVFPSEIRAKRTIIFSVDDYIYINTLKKNQREKNK